MNKIRTFEASSNDQSTAFTEAAEHLKGNFWIAKEQS